MVGAKRFRSSRIGGFALKSPAYRGGGKSPSKHRQSLHLVTKADKLVITGTDDFRLFRFFVVCWDSHDNFSILAWWCWFTKSILPSQSLGGYWCHPQKFSSMPARLLSDAIPHRLPWDLKMANPTSMTSAPVQRVHAVKLDGNTVALWVACHRSRHMNFGKILFCR